MLWNFIWLGWFDFHDWQWTSERSFVIWRGQISVEPTKFLIRRHLQLYQSNRKSSWARCPGISICTPKTRWRGRRCSWEGSSSRCPWRWTTPATTSSNFPTGSTPSPSTSSLSPSWMSWPKSLGDSERWELSYSKNSFHVFCFAKYRAELRRTHKTLGSFMDHIRGFIHITFSIGLVPGAAWWI